TPAFEAVEKQQYLRCFQTGIFGQYQRSQVSLPCDRHFFPDSGEVIQILDHDAEPYDDGLPAVTLRQYCQRRGRAEIGPRLVACGGDLQVRREELQKLFGRAVAPSHVSDLLLPLEP